MFEEDADENRFHRAPAAVGNPEEEVGLAPTPVVEEKGAIHRLQEVEVESVHQVGYDSFE